METDTLVTDTVVTDTHHVAKLDGGDPGLYDGPQTPEQVGGHSKPGQQTYRQVNRQTGWSQTDRSGQQTGWLTDRPW